jgi:Protein-L-isoaspartate(D-aspartate) O-methyltransferase (PCMT)
VTRLPGHAHRDHRPTQPRDQCRLGEPDHQGAAGRSGHSPQILHPPRTSAPIWPLLSWLVEHAPFDKVIVTAAPDLIPPPLIHQLKAGGKMVVPAGLSDAQQLVLLEKHGDGRVTMREILQVRFSQLEEAEPG